MRPPPYASIWFDCDSTLSAIEGVDELATLRDPATAARIAALTTMAMDGATPLEQVYGARLAALAPTAAELVEVAVRYVDRLVTDAAEVVAALHRLGKRVGIISGGMLPAVALLAAHLEIPTELVLAVDVEFDADGNYRGFASDSPLTRAGGKTTLLAARPAVERPLAFVGDGVTDLEAAVVVDRFVGFGGVVRRPAVERAAPFFTAGPGLAATLPYLLTPAELRSLGIAH